jgi:hypothetical protein
MIRCDNRIFVALSFNLNLPIQGNFDLTYILHLDVFPVLSQFDHPLQLLYPFLNILLLVYDRSQLSGLVEALLFQQILDSFIRVAHFYVVNVNDQAEDGEKVNDAPVLLRLEE